MSCLLSTRHTRSAYARACVRGPARMKLGEHPCRRREGCALPKTKRLRDSWTLLRRRGGGPRAASSLRRSCRDLPVASGCDVECVTPSAWKVRRLFY